MKLENSKGTRDFTPEDKIIRNQVVDTLKKVFERYGFSPIETPVIERFDVLTAKAGAGEDSDAFREIFKLTDQGERKLGLRFDLTVPFARYIGMNPTIKMPFKRYQIEPVFRDGPIKLGRYRQFWQCDVDVVGSKKMIADSELLALSLDVFKELELDAYLEVNNRKVLKGIIEFAGIKEELADAVIISIDKLKKIGKDGVREELEKKGIEDTQVAKLLSGFDVQGSTEEKISMLKGILTTEIGKQGISEVEEMFSYFSEEQKQKIEFNVSLARGLGYYTGPIFEGFMKKSKITSSICGGGRYDNLIPLLLGQKKEFPATGISFGLDVISDVLKLARKEESQKTVTQVYVVPIKTTNECFSICQELRDAGMKVDMDLNNKGISKNLAFVNANNIPYSIIVGPKELEQKKVNLRDMKTGKEEQLTIKEVVKKIL